MDPRTEQMLAERRAKEEALAALPRGQRIRAAATGWLSRHRRSASMAMAVIAGVAVTYYVLIAMPARAREQRVAATREAGRQQAEQQLDQSLKLDACLTAAQTVHTANWDESCKTLRRRASCTLPSDIAQSHEMRLLHSREDCFKRHSTQ